MGPPQLQEGGHGTPRTSGGWTWNPHNFTRVDMGSQQFRDGGHGTPTTLGGWTWDATTLGGWTWDPHNFRMVDMGSPTTLGGWTCPPPTTLGGWTYLFVVKVYTYICSHADLPIPGNLCMQ